MKRVFRFAATVFALAAAAILVWADASNAAPVSGTAEARVFASEVNLRASDLPGFKTVFGPGATGYGPLHGQIEKCDGGPIVRGVIHGVVSPIFEQQKAPVQTVVSAVYRVHDPSIAVRYIRAGVSVRGLGCIEREELAKLRAAGLHSKISVYALRTSIGPAVISGVRRVLCVPFLSDCKSGRVRGFIDRLWFAAGPYVVMLGFVAGASNAATGVHYLLPIESHLLGVLYNHARAHKP